MLDLFVENQSKQMTELGLAFSFTPKFTKLPAQGLDCISDFESPTFDELKTWPLDR